MPLIGLLYILVSYHLHREQLWIRRHGVQTEGVISGMAIAREGKYDLVSRFETVVTLRLADGTLQEVRLINGEPVHKPEMDPAEWDRLLQAGLDDVERLRWLLKREARRGDDPRRVVWLEKTEAVSGFFGLPTLPEKMTFHDELVFPEPSEGLKPGEVITSVTMDGNPQRVRENRGDSLMSYLQLREGEPYTPAKRNFLLFCEPYATVFRPVFRYKVDSIEYASVSHIGRHGGPTLALRLFHPCRVYYLPDKPEKALLMADPGPVGGKPLDWFSRFCEGLFAQWGTASLIVLAGLIYLACGLLFITLAVRPSHPLSHE